MAYIEREAVLKMIENAQLISDGEYSGYCTEDIDIEKIPVADVAPARHGMWIYGEIDVFGCDVKCSECGWGKRNVDPVLWENYDGHKCCGHCGSKMDGGITHD